MTGSPLLFAVADGVARITLNRPLAGNAMTGPMVQALLDAAVACDVDPAVRCVVLTGAGRHFCAGGDLGALRAMLDAGAAVPVGTQTGQLHSAISRFARMPKPVLALVNGPAAGAGMSLALVGDVVLAARSARFSTAYRAIGLTADGGLSWQLPRLVGLRRAQELLFTRRSLDAAAAADLGLVTALCDDDALATEGERYAAMLSGSPVGAIGATKHLLLASYGADLEGQLEREARSITRAVQGAEFAEGVAAAVERRAPTFR